MNKTIRTHFKQITVFCLLFCLWLTGTGRSVAQNDLFPDPPEAEELENLAAQKSLQWNRAAIGEAVENYRRASENWTALKKMERAAACLRKAGQMNIWLGEKAKALENLESALTLVKNEHFPEEKSKIYSELSLFALYSGENQKSESYSKEALQSAEQSGSPTAKAAAFFSLAEFNYARNNLNDSLNFYQKSLEFWKQSGDRQGEANTLLNLAYLYLKQNEYQAGLAALETALAIWQEVKDVRGQALTYKALGRFYNYLNERQKALNSYQKAESLFAPDLDFSEQASLSNAIGQVYETYGEWQLSTNYRKKAYELFQKDNHLYGQMSSLIDLIGVSCFKGDFEETRVFLREGERIAEQLNDNFYRGLIREQFGNFYLQQKDYRQAESSYRDGVKLFSPKTNQRQISRILVKLGEIYFVRDDLSAAREYFQQAQALNNSVKNDFYESQTLYFLAKIEEREGNPAKALEYAESAVSLTDNFSADVTNSKLKSNYFSSVYERYELFIGLLMKMHKLAPGGIYGERALQAAERSKARSMLENLQLSEADFIKDAEPETVRREKEIRLLLNAKADQLTDLLSRQADKIEIEKISAGISELELELEEIKARLKQNSPVYSAIKNPAPFNVGEFQKTILDDDSLLLEFSLGEAESYLWLIGKNEVSSYLLPPRAEIENRIEKLRSFLQSREMKPDETIENYQARMKEAEENFSIEARLLSRQLFGQISEKLNHKRLIVVADGKLHYFPIAALPLPEADNDEPFLLTNEIIYEPSAQTLSLLTKAGNRNFQPEKNLLVFSDPIFSSDDARFSASNSETGSAETKTKDTFRFAESLDSLPRLPASKVETESILAIVGPSNADVYSGFAANRERLLETDASRYKIIHFATHGLVNEERPELSGIVLSRFNEKGQKLDESFRIHDIYSLNLNADLVVLSACETGVGKEVKGEGLLSLNNAFLQVGAKTVLSSLWKVEDTATLIVMKNFYAAMKEENLTPSQALRAAQIKLRRNPQFRSPFYWAAFTVQGDFHHKPKITGEKGFWIYALLAIPIGIFCFYLYRKAKSKANKNI